MKTLKNIVALLVVVMVFIACKNNEQPEVKTLETAASDVKELDPNATYAKAEFTINGMTCAMGCAKTIEKKIAKMEGVKSAKVDFDRELAMVEYDEARVTPTLLEETVTNVADTYKVEDMKTVINFSTAKKACKEACEKECCANKDKAEKMACATDCEKACCAKKV